MNGLFRLLGFFFSSLMLLVLGGLFLFEHAVIRQNTLTSGVTPAQEIQRLVNVSTSTNISSSSTNGLAVTRKNVVIAAKPTIPAKEDSAIPQVSSDIQTSKTAITPTVTLSGPLVVARDPAPSTSTNSVTINNAPSQNTALKSEEVITLTNKERVAEGLPPLLFNATLSEMAQAKANDMIDKQYFAHVSPDGTDLTKLATIHHYLYLNVGENLALGDFISSTDVVNGWMNSPGHRANILNKNFTEIGVSVIFANYQGRDVWYAVQEFGRPLSDCPSPDALLKKKIETAQTQIDTLQTSLMNLKNEIETSTLDQATYNSKVTDYNALVQLYNQLVVTIKQDIQSYNAQVEIYNTCAGQ